MEPCWFVTDFNRNKAKFQGLILGWVGLLDAKGIDLINLYGCQAVRRINWCPSHQLIVLIQGPIPEILAKNIKNEKLSFFELATLIFFASFLSKLVTNQRGTMDGTQFL
jgi:hypothetical protein